MAIADNTTNQLTIMDKVHTDDWCFLASKQLASTAAFVRSTDAFLLSNFNRFEKQVEEVLVKLEYRVPFHGSSPGPLAVRFSLGPLGPN